jgi:hypothetical protein
LTVGVTNYRDEDAMELQIRIKKNGQVITEVTDRGDTICSNAKKITNAVGREISDEHIGPECDKVEEIDGDG